MLIVERILIKILATMFRPLLLIIYIIGTQEVHVANCINIWSEWSNWSDCVPRCMIGSQSRTRICISVPCIDDKTETTTCNSLCGCQLVPCSHDSSCIQNTSDPDSYKCACQPGYAGMDSQNCDTAVGSGDSPVDVQLNTSYLTSPFYPDIYPIAQVTEWTVTTSIGKTITIDFTDFNVGPANPPTDCVDAYTELNTLLDSYGVQSPRLTAEEVTAFCPCVLDLLLIYSGEGTNLSNLQGVYCNAQPPPASLVTTNNTIRLVFRTDLQDATDSTTTGKGFNISVSETALLSTSNQAEQYISTSNPAEQNISTSNPAEQNISTSIPAEENASDSLENSDSKGNQSLGHNAKFEVHKRYKGKNFKAVVIKKGK